MHRFLIVGTSFHTLRHYILDRGDEYVVLADIKKAKNPEKKLKRRVLCDFSSEDKIKEALEEVKRKYTIDGVIATYENYILPSAIVSNYLELPGMPLSAAEACTDKYLMRGLFAKSTYNISPDFEEVKNYEDVEKFMENHEYPVILKPASLAKSLLVTKNHNPEELKRNYDKTMVSINDVYAKYSPNREPKVIIEEFLEGPIFSVDAFVDSEGLPHVLEQVVDYQTGYDIGFDDNFHYSRLLPSKQEQKIIESIRETAKHGCVALGMRSSPAHVEIILTNKGPKIVEIGARNGGYRERMHYIANGIDITGNALAIALGQQPDLTSEKNDSCAVLELFPKEPGTFTGIENQEKLEKLESLNYFSIKAKPGNYVGKSADGYKMCAVIILHNSNVEQFNRDLDYVNNNMRVLTKVQE